MKTYAITLTDAHLGVINEALMVAPYGAAAPVIAHINKELSDQLAKDKHAPQDTREK